MASHVELLLLRNVEYLGIVGDVVRVRSGYARNYLLPLCMAESPTPEKIEALKGARTAALAEVSRIRSERSGIIEKLEAHEITLVRACNDQGQLYGAVTQRDIADHLQSEGYGVDMRAVRLVNPVRRVGTVHCTIQFDRDLAAEITVHVKPDRALDLEMERQDAERATEPGDDAAAPELAEPARA
ncbi:MAG: 50S ribosomal protein L9 [Planctomycetota bacterium]|nr:50S ribosomal protein L9 [Planctomycetota bacterium]MDA1106022.1 50S ribosomal protein L9 [Planctomycetota bacterium]